MCSYINHNYTVFLLLHKHYICQQTSKCQERFITYSKQIEFSPITPQIVLYLPLIEKERRRTIPHKPVCDWLQRRMMYSTGNQRGLLNSSWHVAQGLTPLDTHRHTHTHSHTRTHAHIHTHRHTHAHTHTPTHTQHLLNKASQPWRPACLVFYIIIIHNLVHICYSWVYNVCECVCVCVCVCGGPGSHSGDT